MTHHHDDTTASHRQEHHEQAEAPHAPQASHAPQAPGSPGRGPHSPTSPAVVGPTGPVGRATAESFSGVSAAPVAFPSPSRHPYPDPRPPGSPASAGSPPSTEPEDGSGTLMDTLGMEVLAHGAQRTVVRMPVEGARQVAGLLHGGAAAALVETAASLAARADAPKGSLPVGAELAVSHLRPVEGGSVTAEATPVHRGRRTAVYEVSIRDDEGRQVARGTLRSLFT